MPLSAFPKAFIPALCVERSMTPFEWIDLARRELPLDGLEFYWGFVPESREEQLRLAAAVNDAGFAMPMMCYSSDFIQPDRSEWHRQVEMQKRAVEVTARMGGSYCRILTGQRRADVDRETGLELVRTAFLEVIPTAEEHGVTLILENHYKDAHWVYPEFAQRLEVFAELLSRIPEHDYFGVNFDPSNALVAGDDPIEYMRAVKDRIRTMHASDRFLTSGTLEDLRKIDESGAVGYADLLQHGVVGKGAIDYDAVFSILAEIEFGGWISIEDGNDPNVGIKHIQESARFLRAKMSEYGVG